MIKEQEWALILRYLEGNLNPADRERFSNWLKSGEDNQKLLEQLKGIWETPDHEIPHPDVDNAWQMVTERAGIKAVSGQSFHSRYSKERRSTSWQQVWGTRILKIAAIFLVLALIPIIFSRLDRNESMQELRVPLAQKMEVTLSDNSKITLDAGSLLRYPDRFQEDSRQVYLEGEAYFEIASNPRKPFMVNTGDAVITVLGTKFNVRSWPNHVSKIAVTVTEGEVSFRNARLDVPNSQVIISSGQYSMLLGNTRPSAPKVVGMESPLSWIKREKYFQNTPLQEVLDQLERWYDLQIILEDKTLAASRVTIFIEDKPIEETIEVITLMNHLQSRREGRKVILSLKE